jgi:hypothetical protein
MLTFELEFSNSSHMHKHSHSYFDKLWKLGIDYSEFENKKSLLQKVLKSKYAKDKHNISA